MTRLIGTRIRAAFVALTLLGTVVVSGSTAAGASTLTWSESPSAFDSFAFGFPPRTLSFHQFGNGSFSAVSCVSSHFCLAIGTYSSSLPQGTLIEKWDGKAWSVMPRSGVLGGNLAGVSCVSARFCVVVGYGGGSGSAASPLIERWDGANWTLDAAPVATASNNTLGSVSCVSRTSCVAVGAATDGTTSRTLVESWNGVVWSVVASPNPGTDPSGLNGVSCTARTFCIAVGQHRVDSSTVAPLIERWNGAAWTIAASPSIGSFTGLAAVSCASSGFCMGVGATDGSTLVEVSRGGAWSIIPSPTADPGRTSSFTSVSCPNATNCIATDQLTGPSPSAFGGVVRTWNGSDWATGVGFAGTPGNLTGVSCANHRFCFAVGGYSFPAPHGAVALLGRS